MQKKNNLFDESIRRKLEQQTSGQPEPQRSGFSVIKLIALIFVILFALSILLRIIVG